MKLSPHTPVIPTAPLALMCAALAMLALPLWEHAASWTFLVFAGCLGARVFVNWRCLPLPPTWLKLVILAGSTTALVLRYGTIFGVEAAFGTLLILVSLKVAETNTTRDFQVLALLGCFLGLCNLFFEQDLAHWLYVGAAFTAILAARIQFFQARSRKALRRSSWLALRILAQALPLTLLLFLFFPRGDGVFRFSFANSLLGASGLPDKVAPGNVAALASRNDVAFHVRFPDGDMPPPDQLYWRGIVLWNGSGLNWDRGGPTRPEHHPLGLVGPLIRQQIILEPTGGQFLFALDRPASPVKRAMYDSGGILLAEHKFFTPLAYEVASRTENHQTQIWPDEEAAALRRPTRVSSAVQSLADSWRTGDAGDDAVLQRALHFFRTNGFTYSLSPGAYSNAELDDFLFVRKVGFCEHFASAFAALMRLAGVPARLVVGYLGGEYNQVGNYVLVRQSDAHVWCEVWLKDKGWVRVDPTSAIAPDRPNSGLQSYIDTHRAALNLPAAPTGASGMRDAARELRLYWDNLSYQWNLRVLSFDHDKQRAFLSWIGFGSWNDYSLMTGLGFSGVVLLSALLFWLRRPPKSAANTPAGRWYARFCRRLAQAGLQRKPAEGPMHFADRAAAAYPEYATQLRKVGELYAGIRYSPAPPPLAEFVSAIRTLPRLRSRTAPTPSRL